MSENDPYDDLIRAVRSQFDELLALTEGKFEFIRTIQGSTLNKPDDLTLVVNAHGAVLGKTVSTVGVLNTVLAATLDQNRKLVKIVSDLADSLRDESTNRQDQIGRVLGMIEALTEQGPPTGTE